MIKNILFDRRLSGREIRGESPAFFNKLYPYSVIRSHSNDGVILLKRFCDGAKNDLRGVIYLNNGVTIVLN
ncbi:MAG: hypothetical protein GY928_32600 [Colwellia sp.]|nr:hypothetical protein [Colwellia sp.]